MTQATAPDTVRVPGSKAESPWAPLSIPTFRALWLANVVSDIGGAMHGVGAGWLMTSMSPSPLIVSLVQAATMLPMFLLVLPAGVLGDVLDRRKLLIFALLWSVASAALLGVLTLAGAMSPFLLLGLTLMMGIGTALLTPPFQAIVPELVPREGLPGALALNSMGVNIARAVGPAIAGVVIAAAGAGWVFLFNAVSFLFVIFVLWRWKRQPRPAALPPEHFFSAVRNGLRYARSNPQLHAVMVRAAMFFVFASCLWALLPLVGAQKLPGSSNGYAILLSCLGIGAVLAAFTLPRLRSRISPSAITVLAAVLFAAAAGVTAVAGFHACAAAMVFAGWAWLASLSTFNMTTQLVIAEWVRGRGLAVYQIVFFGSQALGSIFWGQLAEMTSVAASLSVAALGLLVGCLTAFRFPLARADEMKLQPSLHWPEPHVLIEDVANRGLILTTVEYRIAPADVASFLSVMREMEQMRRRNGGFSWGLYEDMEEPGRFLEHFLSESWTEHLRQHQRTSVSDRTVQEHARAFHRRSDPPRVTHLAAPGTGGHRQAHDHAQHGGDLE